MLPGPFENFVMRRRLVFVVVRLNVILAHRMVDETVPHQDTPQIRVAVEDDTVKIVNFTLLKLGAAPDRRERRNLILCGAVASAESHDDGAMLQMHRVKMIDHLEISGPLRL